MTDGLMPRDRTPPIRRSGQGQTPPQQTVTLLTATQEEFAHWLSLPPSQRKPRLQQDWGRSRGVNRAATLSEWKRIPEFIELVKERRKEFADSLVSEALHGWQKAIRRGHYDAVRDALIYGGILSSEKGGPTLNVGVQVMDPHKAARLAEYAEKLEEAGE